MTTTNETVKLRRVINLKNYQDAVQYTAKDSPLYQVHVDRFAAATVHFNKYAEVKAAAKRLGYELNAYPVKTASGKAEALTIWIRKENGKAVGFIPFDGIFSRISVDLSNLPAIND